MKKSARVRERSPSVERLQKKLKRLKEQISEKLTVKAGKLPTPEGDEVVKISEPEEIFDSVVTDESDTRFSESSSDKENEESAISPEALEETISAEENNFAELDQETLEILGDDSGCKDEGGLTLYPRLALTWEKILLERLKKEKKVEILQKYPRKGNCPIQAPKLNPEIEASVNV
ncbi:reverse transcriptase and recombinase [Lasius niger]|uniref:Reverse transcriptase and recombinase n=1 Tax=Lasius niger TaxID=67767 RepID=A0A0J7K0D6_LASNI|nr:reverse transcriptase and recombinase [Lasius niger]